MVLLYHLHITGMLFSPNNDLPLGLCGIVSCRRTCNAIEKDKKQDFVFLNEIFLTMKEVHFKGENKILFSFFWREKLSLRTGWRCVRKE
jgi:hypothetical protein